MKTLFTSLIGLFTFPLLISYSFRSMEDTILSISNPVDVPESFQGSEFDTDDPIGSISVGSVEDCIQPGDPNPDPGLGIEWRSYEFKFEGGFVVRGTNVGSGSQGSNVSVTVNGFDMILHISCSDTFYGPDGIQGTADDGFGEVRDPTESEGHPRVASYKLFRYKIRNDGSCRFVTNCAEVVRGDLLPVNLVKFEGTSKDGAIELNWSTAQEIDNDYFEVERSTDGVAYETIATIKGNGTTVVPQDYRYLDLNPAAGLNYYRLKQVDFDLDYEYSNIIVVDTKAPTAALLRIYPNPTNNFINYQVSDVVDRTLDMRLYDQFGRVIRQWKQEPNATRSINIKELQAGIYIMEVQNGSETMRKRFIKQ